MMRSRIFQKGLISRIFALALLWWLLTGGAMHSWIIGIPAILLGLYVHAYLPRISPFRFSLKGAFFFLLYFLKQSFLAGLDVAVRAFHPKLPLNPSLVSYHYRLTNELEVVFFANTISLLPGTLSTHIEKGCVLVHTLDQSQPTYDNLRDLENRIGKVFGEEFL